MAKEYLEVALRRPARALMLEADNHPWFIAQITLLEWEVIYQDVFDMVLVSPSGFEIEMFNGEYAVFYSDNHGNFWEGEPYSERDFMERFRTS